jgi:hypothetical protein
VAKTRNQFQPWLRPLTSWLRVVRCATNRESVPGVCSARRDIGGARDEVLLGWSHVPHLPEGQRRCKSRRLDARQRARGGPRERSVSAQDQAQLPDLCAVVAAPRCGLQGGRLGDRVPVERTRRRSVETA